MVNLIWWDLLNDAAQRHGCHGEIAAEWDGSLLRKDAPTSWHFGSARRLTTTMARWLAPWRVTICSTYSVHWTPSNHIKHDLSTVALAKVFGSPTKASLETDVEQAGFLHEAGDGCRCLWVQICTETGSEASTCLGCSWNVATSKSDTRNFTLTPLSLLAALNHSHNPVPVITRTT